MTQEQKAKAYDEAVKRAKELLEIGVKDARDKRVVLSFFPELKESEDEKIRKELIKHLKEGAEGYEPAGGSSDYQRWLAWLEKQNGNIGGISPNWSEEDKAHIESILERLEGMCKKGATYTATRFAVSQDIDWLKSLKGRVQPQPKQEWSEEDEHRIKDTIYFLDTAKKHYASTEELDACIDWLKSLRPHQQWKPSSEQIGL
jgi:transposase-like protein